MNTQRWFYASKRKDTSPDIPGGFQIETFGTGDQPRCMHWYATEEEWKHAIELLKRYGYERSDTCTK